MLVTEKEAAKIGCPLLTLAFGYQGRFTEADHVRCQGSRCMLWRWDAEQSLVETERKGFCGLAGKPLSRADAMPGAR
jgi:hypothetical protein